MYYNNNGMIKFVDFKKHVEAGVFDPVYAAIGDDAFLISSAVKMLERLVDMPEINSACYGDSSDIDAMILQYGQLPMMSGKKLMKCEMENMPPKTLERFLKYVHHSPNPDTLVIFAAQKLPACLAANAGKYTVVDCARLDEKMTVKWIAAQAAKRGASISVDAAHLLANYCLCNLTRIEVEFEKLCEVAYGRMIEESDVAAYVVPDGDYKIYELSDALAKKDVKRTYAVYDSIIVNTAPVAVIGTLYGHFRRLLYAAVSKCDRELLARYLRVKPYAMEMAARQAKTYTPKRLKKIVDRLSQIDADFKSGRINDRVALDTFIAETLCAA